MKTSRLPPDLLRVWQKDVALVESSEDKGGQRASRTSAIAATIRSESLRRKQLVRLRQFGYVLACAAALAALGLGLGPRLRGGRTAREDPARQVAANPRNHVFANRDTFIDPPRRAGEREQAEPRLLKPGEILPLEVGVQVSTGLRGEASVELGDTSRLDVGANTQLWLVRDEATKQQIQVNRGHVLISVQKGTGREVSVSTPDARVIVRGTVFTVDVHPTLGPLPRTRVDVREGSVLVVSAQGSRIVEAGNALTTGIPAIGGGESHVDADGDEPHEAPSPLGIERNRRR